MKLRNPEVRIESTSRCNSNCAMCPRDDMTREQCDMPIEDFKNLVNQCKFMGAEVISCFGFGEPLLAEEFLQMDAKAFLKLPDKRIDDFLRLYRYPGKMTAETIRKEKDKSSYTHLI